MTTTTTEKHSLKSYDAQWRKIISDDASEKFESSWPNLLACFDVNAVYGAIAQLIHLEGLSQAVKDDFSVRNLVKFTEDSFLELLNRGALQEYVRVNPLPDEAQRELDRLAGVAPAEVDPAVAAREAKAAALDQCVADYRRMPSQDFKRKYLSGDPAKRAVYEQAIAAGRI